MSSITTVASTFTYQAYASPPRCREPRVVHVEAPCVHELTTIEPAELVPNAVVADYAPANPTLPPLQLSSYDGRLWTRTYSGRGPTGLEDYITELRAPANPHELDGIRGATASDLLPFDLSRTPGIGRLVPEDALAGKIISSNKNDTLRRVKEAVRDVLIVGNDVHFHEPAPFWTLHLEPDRGSRIELHRWASEPAATPLNGVIVQQDEPIPLACFALDDLEAARRYADAYRPDRTAAVDGSAEFVPGTFTQAPSSELNLRIMLPLLLPLIEPMLVRLSPEAASSWKTLQDVARRFGPTCDRLGLDVDAAAVHLQRLQHDIESRLFHHPAQARNNAPTALTMIDNALAHLDFLGHTDFEIRPNSPWRRP